MKILGIVGSPHKAGTTDMLVSEVLRGAKDSGSQIQKINLSEKKIEYCRGDRECMKNVIFLHCSIPCGKDKPWVSMPLFLMCFISYSSPPCLFDRNNHRLAFLVCQRKGNHVTVDTEVAFSYTHPSKKQFCTNSGLPFSKVTNGSETGGFSRR